MPEIWMWEETQVALENSISQEFRAHHVCQERGYDDSHVQHGLISIIINEEESHECVIYSKVLSNDSMKPTKLKQH
ncbi:SCAN domain-containing protein 3-like isoform X2 [Tachypleus tridentatus]|uniref:SCAN domain-containing protein 3-like isoform X2 n=1 Tax=Tachypleus tridentatus TaxID=6853 RepID=UPI003FD69E45